MGAGWAQDDRGVSAAHHTALGTEVGAANVVDVHNDGGGNRSIRMTSFLVATRDAPVRGLGHPMLLRPYRPQHWL